MTNENDVRLFIDRGRAAQHAVNELVGASTAEPNQEEMSISQLFDEFISLIFDGFMVEWVWDPRSAEPMAQMVVTHPCGWRAVLARQAYLADVINGPVADHRRSGCTP